MQLILVGALSLTGTAASAASLTSAPATDTNVGFEAAISSLTVQPAITADPTVKLDFNKSAVQTIPAPPPVHPVLGVMSVNPEAHPSSNFDVAASITAALGEVGKSFPTGWNQPGECLVAAKRWIVAGGGNWYGAGTPIGNYAGAKEVAYENAAPGDIIQYLSPSSPHSWVAGVHTLMVLKNNGDGTLNIVEANNPGGSGFVSTTQNWKPSPPAGTVSKVFRF